MILYLILSVDLDKSVFMVILSKYLSVVGRINYNIRTVPDKACYRKAHGMEVNAHLVLKLNAVGCSRSGLTYLDILNVRFHVVDITYFIGNSGNIGLIHSFFCLLNVDISYIAVFTGNTDINRG